MTYAKITKTGNRPVNEDTVAVAERGGDYCFIVADGLGGHGRGDEASQIAARAMADEFCGGGSPGGAAASLSRAFMSAQNAVQERRRELRTNREMLTTAVAVAVVGTKCAWGHIGDSRLYMFRGNKIKAQTLDHSVAQMLVLSDRKKESDTRGHPDRNKLLRVIGEDWDTPEFELSKEYKTATCQAFLLCTDGFWELIDEKRMCELLKNSRDADEWLNAMTGEVEKNGADKEMDNYSAIAVIV